MTNGLMTNNVEMLRILLDFIGTPSFLQAVWMPGRRQPQ